MLVWALVVVAVLPAVFHWGAHATTGGFGRSLRVGIVYLIAFLICYAIYHREKLRIGRKRALALVFLVFLLTSTVNFMHKVTVDENLSFFPDRSNLQWQIWVQDATIDLSPSVLPHSYRFLPNAVVRWMQMGGIGYPAARNLYRLVFGLLLFYALYRYARLYTDYLGALIAMLLTAVIYPISFQQYAGQLTDPMSHLSFLLCFIFLQVGDFPSFLSAMLIGSLAKETVLAMAGYYVLFCRSEKTYRLRSMVVYIAAAVAYFGVRLLVLKGHVGYQAISGVPAEHVLLNWRSQPWRPLFLLTAGALLPFLVLGWKETPAVLKRLTFFLLPVLFVSNLVFGWLQETRNYMPLVFVLSVVAGRFLSAQFRSSTKTEVEWTASSAAR